uniref:NADH:ubiquinone reductase (H(+)-translocating) n=1 Tax=Pteria penguin TaxID=113549 RepID=A0A1P8CZ14_PTEPN|nr:NADH dehydrogenase subunit 5 [Pteria penguin]
MGVSLIFLVCGLFLVETGESLSLDVSMGWLCGVSVSFRFSFDGFSFLYLWVVWVITGSVFVFMKIYMGDDSWLRDLSWVMVLFVISMSVLVVSGNVVTALVGWEGLGLTSYYLIQYYGTYDGIGGAYLTGLSNRVGDVCLMLSCGIQVSGIGLKGVEMFTWAMVLLVCAAGTKSSQWPMVAWLPSAMAAPTPVSALVHSSTLVTGGVILLIRSSSWWMVVGGLNKWIFLVGLFTINVAGAGALYKDDMKEVVALSTMSHLGYMMLGLAANKPELAMFHCCMHALCKAGLFICVGMVMKSQQGSQRLESVDVGVLEDSGIFGWGAYVFCFSLMGMPCMAVSMPKEQIAGMCLEWSGSLLYSGLMVSGLFLTVFYSVHLMWNMSVKGWANSVYCAEESKSILSMGALLDSVVFFLIMCSLLLGYLGEGLIFYQWVGVSEWGDTKLVYLSFVGFTVFWCYLKGEQESWDLCWLYWPVSGGLLRGGQGIASLVHMEEVSGQLSAKVLYSVSKSVKRYGEGWAEKPYVWGVYFLKHVSSTGFNYSNTAPPVMSGLPSYWLSLLLLGLAIYVGR